MELYQTIVAARKRKGLTQEQLADAAGLTVRTIQRIESGESTPRAYTLKTLASALDIHFENLASGVDESKHIPVAVASTPAPLDAEEGKHFLQVVGLSCFSYLVIPMVHFLVPALLIKKNRHQNPKIIAFARRLVRAQLYWMAGLLVLLLVTLAYNLTRAAYFEKTRLINYLWPFLFMYLLNAFLITRQLLRIHQTDFSLSHPRVID